MSSPYVHPSASVAQTARIGRGSKIWHDAQVREGAFLGERCIVGKGAYIDRDVAIGNDVKIQNYALIYRGTTIEDGVFVGPLAVFTNDRQPRAINRDGSQKSDADWQVTPIRVGYGASIGAGGIVLPGVCIGRFALVGAGAVVTRAVPEYGLVVGNPARLVSYACACGNRLDLDDETGWCRSCGQRYARGGSGLIALDVAVDSIGAHSSEGRSR